MLVEFWTFTCINWIRTLPYVRSWFEKYRDDGLFVLGIHTPEFEVERDIEHVRRAAAEMRIEYPIAVDSDYAIWRAFGNQYWPALYFADADGQIRHHRFGEGEYEYSEIVIQLLLRAAGASNVSRKLPSVDARGVEAPADWDDLRSPESLHRLRPQPRTSPPRTPSPGTSLTNTLCRTPFSSTTGGWPAIGPWAVRRPC